MNRRQFVISAAAASGAALAQTPKQKPILCIFSKHMGTLSWDEVGAKAKELGFGGVDLTVRPKGHVLPERVTEDLPRAVEAIRKHGLSVPMVTTDLKDASDPAAKPTFEAMKKLGIKLYKIGYWPYKKEPDVLNTIADSRRKLQGLLALSAPLGLTAGLHNHSGAYFGTAVWDFREILSGVAPNDAGYYFDPGHSVVEGGAFGWRTSLDVVLPRLKMSAIKDFYWERQGAKWKLTWCPLGQGMVPWSAVFAEYARRGFSGPLSLHTEYPNGDDLPNIQKDLNYLKGQIDAAYGI